MIKLLGLHLLEYLSILNTGEIHNFIQENTLLFKKLLMPVVMMMI